MILTYDPPYEIAYVRLQEKSVHVETIRHELHVDNGSTDRLYVDR